ncbi:MAG: xanthine dehydrogenase family protein subunit M, partial [Nitrospinota bacterium]
ASVSMMGVGPTALRAEKACESLVGAEPTAALLEKAARLAREEADPDDDVHATADFRRDLVEHLTRACLARAFRSAGANLG